MGEWVTALHYLYIESKDLVFPVQTGQREKHPSLCYFIDTGINEYTVKWQQ